MTFSTVKLLAIEHLNYWPNRLHVLLAILFPAVVFADALTGHFAWQPVAIAIGLIASVLLRVWLWDLRVWLWDRQRAGRPHTRLRRVASLAVPRRFTPSTLPRLHTNDRHRS